MRSRYSWDLELRWSGFFGQKLSNSPSPRKPSKKRNENDRYKKKAFWSI